MQRFVTALTCAALLTLATTAPTLAQLTPQQHEVIARCSGISDFARGVAAARDAGRPRQALLDTQTTPAMPRQPAAVSLQVQREVIDAAYDGPQMEPPVWGLVTLWTCMRLGGNFGQLGRTVGAQIRDMMLSKAWADEAEYFGISPAPQSAAAICTGYGRMAEALATERDRGATRAQLLERVHNRFATRPSAGLGMRTYLQLASAVAALRHIGPAAMRRDAEDLCRTGGWAAAPGAR